MGPCSSDHLSINKGPLNIPPPDLQHFFLSFQARPQARRGEHRPENSSCGVKLPACTEGLACASDNSLCGDIKRVLRKGYNRVLGGTQQVRVDFGLIMSYRWQHRPRAQPAMCVCVCVGGGRPSCQCQDK
jgi:hypothetical protein